jgi:protein-S-isoprenylcysteine O-methyltransferase Ste14
MKTKQFLALIFPITGLFIIPALLLFDFQTLSFDFQISSTFLIPGAVIFLFGMALLVESTLAIHKIGQGTIAPWYPTQNLVISGSYSYTRNPMIIGALMVLAGEALVFGSLAILIYLFIFFIVNDIYFNMVEEPNLEKRFSGKYREYKNNVPRWLPKKLPWKRPKKDS